MKTAKKSSKKNQKAYGNAQKKEVARILKANQSECGCDESYIPFLKSFITHLVKEADEAPTAEPQEPGNFTTDQNQKDFENSLDTSTDPNQFDTEGTDPNVAANAISAIQDWSKKLDEFAEFMNSPNSQSLHKIIATEDRPGSLLRGVTRKASDSITRIAGEIEKLKAVLDQFIIMAPKKQRDTDQLKMA
jgi:hypothetical protein